MSSNTTANGTANGTYCSNGTAYWNGTGYWNSTSCNGTSHGHHAWDLGRRLVEWIFGVSAAFSAAYPGQIMIRTDAYVQE